jgi:hypothetical protein
LTIEGKLESPGIRDKRLEAAKNIAEINKFNDYTGGSKKTKLESRTVKELQALCAKRRIVYSGLRKAELVAALRKK